VRQDNHGISRSLTFESFEVVFALKKSPIIVIKRKKIEIEKETPNS